MIVYTKDGIPFQIDEEDAERVSKYLWRLDCGYMTASQKKINGIKNRLKLHRYIMQAPFGMQVDHINHDPLDNRKNNLRICLNRQNQYNQKISIRNTSGYKGVRKIGKRFIAKIKFQKKDFHLGCFNDIKEAARAYDEKAKELFGEYAFTNF